MSRDYPVRGLNDLMQFLNAFPANLKRNAIAGGLRGAGGVIRDEARVLAAKSSGQMAKAIRTSSVRTNQDGTMSIKVRLDPKAPHAYLGILSEYGVDRHFISAGDSGKSIGLLGKAADIGGVDVVARRGRGENQPEVLAINGQYVTGAVLHPGHSAHPFMRPALEYKAAEALQVFGVRIRAFIEGKTGFAMPADDDE